MSTRATIQTSFLSEKKPVTSNTKYVDDKFAKMGLSELRNEIAKNFVLDENMLELITSYIKYEGYNLEEIMRAWATLLEDVGRVDDKKMLMQAVVAMGVSSIFKVKIPMKMKYMNNNFIENVVNMLKARNLTVARVCSVMALQTLQLMAVSKVKAQLQLPFPSVDYWSQVPGAGTVCYNLDHATEIWSVRLRQVGRIQSPQNSKIDKEIVTNQMNFFLLEINSPLYGDTKEKRMTAVKDAGLTEFVGKYGSANLSLPLKDTESFLKSVATQIAKDVFNTTLTW